MLVHFTQADTGTTSRNLDLPLSTNVNTAASRITDV